MDLAQGAGAELADLGTGPRGPCSLPGIPPRCCRGGGTGQPGPGGVPGGAAVRHRRILGTGIWCAGRRLGDHESSVPGTACPAAERKEELVLLASKELHRSKISINKARTRKEQTHVWMTGLHKQRGLPRLQTPGVALAADGITQPIFASSGMFS